MKHTGFYTLKSLPSQSRCKCFSFLKKEIGWSIKFTILMLKLLRALNLVNIVLSICHPTTDD